MHLSITIGVGVWWLAVNWGRSMGVGGEKVETNTCINGVCLLIVTIIMEAGLFMGKFKHPRKVDRFTSFGEKHDQFILINDHWA